MKAYRIKNEKLIGIRIIQSVNDLLPDEIEGDFIRPEYQNGQLIETWTQADQDAEDEQTRSTESDQGEREGMSICKQIRDFIVTKRHKGQISGGQFKNIRITLRPVFDSLRSGDWDIAEDEINAIQRPSGDLGLVYDKIKTEIEEYNV